MMTEKIATADMNRREFIDHIEALRPTHPELADFVADRRLGHYWANDRVRDEYEQAKNAISPEAIERERHASIQNAIGDPTPQPRRDLALKHYNEMVYNLARIREAIAD